MDDQFGGRTDDGLFDDDFEPVESEAVLTKEPQHQPPEPVAPALPVQTQQPVQPTPEPRRIAPGLASSRYADPPPQEPTAPVAAAAPAPAPATTTTDTNVPAPAPAQAPTPEQDSTTVNQPPPDAPSGPKKKGPTTQESQATKQARLGSGANPRQKLTEAELSAKMAQMKLLNAEKTRKFEKAEQDEKQHQEALARGREEQKKRRQEAEERKKRTEANQKQLNSEREKNRERKMKAMGMKEGGWDEGKEAAAEEESRRGFRGANGGIRGSRFAGKGGHSGEDQPDVDRFLDERSRGRGRGRGRGNGSRGQGAAGGSSDRPQQPKKQAIPTKDDFPSLPADNNKKVETGERPKPVSVPSYPPKYVGKWDEEVAEEEANRPKGDNA